MLFWLFLSIIFPFNQFTAFSFNKISADWTIRMARQWSQPSEGKTRAFFFVLPPAVSLTLCFKSWTRAKLRQKKSQARLSANNFRPERRTFSLISYPDTSALKKKMWISKLRADGFKFFFMNAEAFPSTSLENFFFFFSPAHSILRAWFWKFFLEKEWAMWIKWKNFFQIYVFFLFGSFQNKGDEAFVSSLR